MPRTRRHYPVSPKELKDGSHIYKCRFQLGDRNNTSGWYWYSHHGIFHKKSGKVISLGWTHKPDEVVDEVDCPMGAIKKRLILAAASFLNKVLNVRVHFSELNEFVNKRGEVYVYQYDQSAEICDEADSAVEILDRNGTYAAKIAEWFAKHPKAFGKYRLAEWNCEHFATFCHITSFDVETLKREYPGEGNFERSFLCRKGIPFSLQAKRYFDQNSEILRPSANDEDDQILVNMYEHGSGYEPDDEEEKCEAEGTSSFGGSRHICNQRWTGLDSNKNV